MASLYLSIVSRMHRWRRSSAVSYHYCHGPRRHFVVFCLLPLFLPFVFVAFVSHNYYNAAAKFRFISLSPIPRRLFLLGKLSYCGLPFVASLDGRANKAYEAEQKNICAFQRKRLYSTCITTEPATKTRKKSLKLSLWGKDKDSLRWYPGIVLKKFNKDILLY